MFKNSVSQANSDSDKIRAKVELAIDRPTATAFISLHEAHDQDAPFQKINVDFEMEELMAELSLDKSTRRSGLELRSVKTKLNRIRPMNTEKYEGRVSSLVKEQMPSHMKRYIERGLKNFLEKELSSIMSQGKHLPIINSMARNLSQAQNSIRVFIYRCSTSKPRITVCTQSYVTRATTLEVNKNSTELYKLTASE